MKLGLRYQTSYRYEEAVGFSPTMYASFPQRSIQPRPPPGFSRRSPKRPCDFSRDVFENTVASCFFPERSKELEFRLALNLDLDEKDPFHFILENDAVETPFEYETAIAKYSRLTGKGARRIGWSCQGGSRRPAEIAETPPRRCRAQQEVA